MSFPDTSVDAGSVASGGESSAASSDGNPTATAASESAAPVSDGNAGEASILAAVEAAMSGNRQAQPTAPAQAQQETPLAEETAEPAEEELPPVAEPDIQQLLAMDEEAFEKADGTTRQTGFRSLRTHVQALNERVAALEPDAKYGQLVFSENPGEFLNTLGNESPVALANLCSQIVQDVPDFLIKQLQASGRLPANLDQLTTATTTDTPEDLPAELHDVWNSLPQELRDDLSLDSAAKRNDYLAMKNAQFQADKARTDAEAQAIQTEEARRLDEYEASAWSAVMQQVAQAVPLTGDKEKDAALYRHAALVAYHDVLPKDPTTAALLAQAKAAVQAGEMRKAASLQAALIAAGQAATAKVLEPVTTLIRENTQLKQRLQSSQPQQFSLNNGQSALPNNGNQPASVAELNQMLAQKFGLPLQ